MHKVDKKASNENIYSENELNNSLLLKLALDIIFVFKFQRQFPHLLLNHDLQKIPLSY